MYCSLLIKFQPKVKIFTPTYLAVFMIAVNLIGTGVGLVMAAPITGIVNNYWNCLVQTNTNNLWLF